MTGGDILGWVNAAGVRTETGAGLATGTESAGCATGATNDVAPAAIVEVGTNDDTPLEIVDGRTNEVAQFESVFDGIMRVDADEACDGSDATLEVLWQFGNTGIDEATAAIGAGGGAGGGARAIPAAVAVAIPMIGAEVESDATTGRVATATTDGARVVIVEGTDADENGIADDEDDTMPLMTIFGLVEDDVAEAAV